MYGTYITIYSGNKLPPFYIGYSKIANIESGYKGSVSSKKYKSIWKDEIKNNKHLFRTIVIKRFNLEKEALAHEKYLQTFLNVIHNPLYTNLAISNEKFFSYRNVKKRPLSEEQKQNLRLKNKEQFDDPIKRDRHLRGFLAADGNHRNKIWINDGKQNKRVTENIFKKDYSNWCRGRLLGPGPKFYEHGNRRKDPKSGRFMKGK